MRFRIYRKAAAFAFILFLASTPSFADTPPMARKFDEFELTNIYFGDMKARLDSFHSEALMKEPNSQAYVILYRSRAGYSRFHPWQIRDYLVRMRGVPAKRVRVVYGGCREVPTLELWVVSEGAKVPKASPTVLLKNCRKH